MNRGEVIHYRDGEDWIRCIVLTALGEGLSGVVMVVRRLSDGQRLLLDREGDLVEVPG